MVAGKCFFYQIFCFLFQLFSVASVLEGYVCIYALILFIYIDAMEIEAFAVPFFEFVEYFDYGFGSFVIIMDRVEPEDYVYMIDTVNFILQVMEKWIDFSHGGIFVQFYVDAPYILPRSVVIEYQIITAQDKWRTVNFLVNTGCQRIRYPLPQQFP